MKYKEAVKQFLGISEEQFHERYNNAFARTHYEFKGLEFEYIEDWYKHTDSIIFEQAKKFVRFKREDWLNIVRKACETYNCQTILDYGGGIGCDSRNLAQDFDVTMVEIPSKTLNFAQYWNNTFTIRPNYWLLDQKFDCVICFEVLECVSNPYELLKALSKHTTKILCVSSLFRTARGYTRILRTNKNFGEFIELILRSLGFLEQTIFNERPGIIIIAKKGD